MLSNDQKKLLKMAQRDAGLDDNEYRDAIAMATQMEDCRSSTDPRLTDEHVDRLMKYFEAVYWNRPDVLHHQSKVFRARGYWAGKNQKGNTSRDRHVAATMSADIQALEHRMSELGFNDRYCATIRRRAVTAVAYKAALERTIKATEKKNQTADQPF
jgi:hypothetical protein